MIKRFPVLAALPLVLGAATVLGAGSAQAAINPCGQGSHVWMATSGGSLGGGGDVNVKGGSVAYRTGVVTRNTYITFHYQYDDGQTVTPPVTSLADGNCVVHHEANGSLMPGAGHAIRVTADYIPWETGEGETVYGSYAGTIHTV
jgi:hypothetical protein